MKTYKNLTAVQKIIFNQIEHFYMLHPTIQSEDFVTVLGVLINKFKQKKGDYSDKKSNKELSSIYP